MGYAGWMIRVTLFQTALTAMILAGPCPAEAGPAQTTQYTYYPVSGRSPAEIYRVILDRGPTVDGAKAIAATNARVVQNYSLAQDGAYCRVSDLRLTLRFTVQLPQLTNASALPPSDRLLWQRFAVFLKAHELQHTKLWLRCAAELQRKVEAIAAPSCKDAAGEAEALWRRLKTYCDKQQVNFDREQRSELAAQPFMQRAIQDF